MEKVAIIAFETTTHAVALEKYFKENNLKGRLIPLPNELSAGCGLAWKTECNDKNKVIEFLKDKNLSYKLVEVI